MTDRRGFLQQGMALSALPFVAGTTLAPSAPRATSLARPAMRRHPEQIIFDDRFEAARLFARQAQRLALPLHRISGDVTELWYDDLYHRWSSGSGVSAGMTSVAALFCLEQLAFRHDRRVIFRADHVRRPDGRVAHTLC
ncbi:MAG TPA: hypothetical protein VKT19_01345, partial [Steroidobacteraceae bacterium]|nr:hypothetical protein [Steroidobacteraceae bacterium]